MRKNMKISINKFGTTCIDAEDGMALKRKEDEAPTTITRVALAFSDSPENWEDCEYGDPLGYGIPEEETE